MSENQPLGHKIFIIKRLFSKSGLTPLIQVVRLIPHLILPNLGLTCGSELDSICFYFIF